MSTTTREAYLRNVCENFAKLAAELNATQDYDGADQVQTALCHVDGLACDLADSGLENDTFDAIAIPNGELTPLEDAIAGATRKRPAIREIGVVDPDGRMLVALRRFEVRIVASGTVLGVGVAIGQGVAVLAWRELQGGVAVYPSSAAMERDQTRNRPDVAVVWIDEASA